MNHSAFLIAPLVPCVRWLTILAATILLAAPGAQAARPWEDEAFNNLTERPDADLVVVRERAFELLDLSRFGLGVTDYVQSIYFRLHAGPKNRAVSVAGTVVFPEDVKILGFVTNGAKLGGGKDDGVASGLDALFGVNVHPDEYSDIARGFERGGKPGSSEFILADSDRSFAFGLNVTQGLDDFRVIIDYGSSFPDDLSFDLEFYDVGKFGGADPSLGIQIGSPDGRVVGNGDFGEIGALRAIPLTSPREPVPSTKSESEPDPES